VDGWRSVEQLETVFANSDVQAFIASTGAAGAPPKITLTEAIESRPVLTPRNKKNQNGRLS
jgi:hypothetical protein